MQQITELLANPPAAAGRQARNEYDRLATKSAGKRKGKPEWYSFYKGPCNIFELAKHLGLAASYKVFYRHWSQVAHGSDILRRGRFSSDDGVAIDQLRHPGDVQDLTLQTMTQTFHVFRDVVQRIVPAREADLGAWYSGVQSVINRLTHETRLFHIDD